MNSYGILNLGLTFSSFSPILPLTRPTEPTAGRRRPGRSLGNCTRTIQRS
ncbi:unnamed protein product [Symbiodinium sp. CCMP2456]|nr:unnamed protein product [Symbiodinium sp. CCMP2456]